MNEVMVFQVRHIDPHGNIRIVHAYETEEQARSAIQVMRGKNAARYDIVKVPNRPDLYWGINFPPKT